MAEFKRQTFLFSTGKQFKLNGNGFFINRSLEIGEGFVPNLFSQFEEQTDGKLVPTVSNPHKLTPDELHELADYNIRLWLDIKEAIRCKGVNDPNIFSRDKARPVESNTVEKPRKSKKEETNSTTTP